MCTIMTWHIHVWSHNCITQLHWGISKMQPMSLQSELIIRNMSNIKCRNEINSEKIGVPDGIWTLDPLELGFFFFKLMSVLHVIFLIILKLIDLINTIVTVKYSDSILNGYFIQARVFIALQCFWYHALTLYNRTLWRLTTIKRCMCPWMEGNNLWIKHHTLCFW